jgi:phenylacetate-CoA ligase
MLLSKCGYCDGTGNLDRVMTSFLSRYLVYPAWDLKNRGIRLKTLRELEKTQWLPESELRRRQWERLKTALSYAYENCEYYRDVFDRIDLNPFEIQRYSDFFKIPILTKKDVRDYGDKLISKLHRKEDLVMAKTGGSTGTALIIYCDKACRDMRGAAAMRSDRWADWSFGDKRAAIWGNPPIAKTLRERIRNALLSRTIFLDTVNLNDRSMGEFVDLYRRYKPSVIFGHSHSIFMFSKFIQNKGISDISPMGIISTSMTLMDNERDFIERVFGCRVTNRYGCEETGLIACECEKNEGLHLNIDHLYIEFLKDDGTQAMAGEEGKIVVTELFNRGMPLIRYRVEDVGVPTDRRCSCGRGLPLMKNVSGRTADFLLKEDGALVAGVSIVERTLTAIKGIEQMQIVQEDINKIILNIVRDKDFDATSERKLIREFKKLFGVHAVIVLKYADVIPQESSGKYRFSICKVNTPYMN